MLHYDWHFDRVFAYWDAFISGIVTTLGLSAAIICFSTALGVCVGIALRRNTWWRPGVLLLIDAIKGIPPLVIILLGYFALTADVIGVTVGAFWAFVLSLGINVAAFIADLTRASISNVPSEYLEMGAAMGFTDAQLTRLVAFPMAVRELIPPLSYLYIETIKLTSLASVIAVRETVYVAEAIITNTSRSLEVWIIVGLVYLVLVMPALVGARILERRFKKEVGIYRPES